ncbi:general odorant-binding protein 28a [Battus philenor]|uniref:general odorant-binding protein 28a n=1 Tax=Battus philenor TaxID=42288 RepID=UPI0035CEAACA
MKATKLRRVRNSGCEIKMNRTFSNFTAVMTILLLTSAFYLAFTFKPITKEEHIEKFNKMNNEVEPFRRNLTECARQVRASMTDVETFLKRIPQSTLQGKCFVACILKRNAIIRNNKIDHKALLEANLAVYGDDSEVISRLKTAMEECNKAVEGIFEICEYASVFNDCMHIKMEHILDKVTMERRMEALGQMTSNPDEWTDEEDEILKLVRDEL